MALGGCASHLLVGPCIGLAALARDPSHEQTVSLSHINSSPVVGSSSQRLGAIVSKYGTFFDDPKMGDMTRIVETEEHE